MPDLYHKIVDKYVINNSKCHKLLSSDGITSQDLVIEKIGGVLEGIRLNTRSEIRVLPNIVTASGIAKNLDEYQYIICSEVREMPDTNPFKCELQKYRIVIITSFGKLVSVLLLKSDKQLHEWNYFAQILLTHISEIVVKVRLKEYGYHNINKDLKPMFDYFGLSESDVESLLRSIYG
jgi:hypothetical protein